MKVANRIFIFIVLMAAIIACEEEHSVTRSEDLSIYGSTETFVGDVTTFEAPLYVLNDARTWTWGVEGDGASTTTGDGEFFDVSFSKPGTYIVSLAEGNRYGEMEIEVSSKVLALDGDVAVRTETYEEDIIEIPLDISNYFANTVEIDFSVSGTAIEGVDYEVLSDSPLILDENSTTGEPDPDTDEPTVNEYAIYIKILPDAQVDSEGKTIVVTLNSLVTELADEVVLEEDVDYLSTTIVLEDDLKDVFFSILLPEEVTSPEVRSFEVKLSTASSVPITVNYSFSGTGVSDATPDGPSEITFQPGETSKLIYLQFNADAFDQQQVVTVELNSITSVDNEVSIDGNKNLKTFVIPEP